MVDRIGVSFVETLEMQGQVSSEAALVLRAARVRSPDTLYAFLTHLPGVAQSVGLDAARLTNIARTSLAAQAVAEIETELAGAPPASTLEVLGALEPPNAPAASTVQATIPMPTGPQPTVSYVNGAAIDHRTNARWPVRNQWRRGTCVAHAVTALAEWLNGMSLASELPDLSEQYLFARAKQADGWNGDGTWLRYAASVLRTHGICDELLLRYNPEPLPPDHGQLASLPSPAPVAQFMNLATYHSAMPRTGAAQQLYNLLAAGAPVALSVAVFVDPVNRNANTWNVTDALWYGEVGDPLPTMISSGGHAVCVTGYTPSTAAAGGGWFTLRNSWGDVKWGSRLPSSGHVAPVAGWGAISAEYVEKYSWEMLAQ